MSSDVRTALSEYVADRVAAGRLVATVARAYYGDARSGMREALAPVMAVVERAAPGVVELAASTGKPGFDVQLAERPFPKEYEADLRRAAAEALAALAAAPAAHARAGVLGRLVAALRRALSA